MALDFYIYGIHRQQLESQMQLQEIQAPVLGAEAFTAQELQQLIQYYAQSKGWDELQSLTHLGFAELIHHRSKLRVLALGDVADYWLDQLEAPTYLADTEGSRILDKKTALQTLDWVCAVIYLIDLENTWELDRESWPPALLQAAERYLHQAHLSTVERDEFVFLPAPTWRRKLQNQAFEWYYWSFSR